MEERSVNILPHWAFQHPTHSSEEGFLWQSNRNTIKVFTPWKQFRLTWRIIPVFCEKTDQLRISPTQIRWLDLRYSSEGEGDVAISLSPQLQAPRQTRGHTGSRSARATVVLADARDSIFSFSPKVEKRLCWFFESKRFRVYKLGTWKTLFRPRGWMPLMIPTFSSDVDKCLEPLRCSYCAKTLTNFTS